MQNYNKQLLVRSLLIKMYCGPVDPSQQTTSVQSFEFGNGSRISDEKLVVLEFKYLQNKKW